MHIATASTSGAPATSSGINSIPHKSESSTKTSEPSSWFYSHRSSGTSCLLVRSALVSPGPDTTRESITFIRTVMGCFGAFHISGWMPDGDNRPWPEHLSGSAYIHQRDIGVNGGAPHTGGPISKL